MQWTDDFKEVSDQILKFAPTVPEEKTYFYYDMFRERLGGKVEPTTSGHGSIDLIVPGCHKASGLKRLAERWGISPEQCAAFGDGGNDIEMLNYCGYSYAMENAPGFCLNNIRKNPDAFRILSFSSRHTRSCLFPILI